jgi:hypothetical protein
MIALLEALEQSAPVVALKSSFIVYPVINALHILAIGTVVVSATLVDLRILGALPAQSSTFAPMMKRLAFSAFAVAFVTGFAMFSIQASSYAANPAFRLKLVFLALAGLNLAVFSYLFGSHCTEVRQHAARVLAFLSIALWLAVLFSGRFIAYV